jgi:hypothetical protein
MLVLLTKANPSINRMSYECANPEFYVPHKPYYLRETTNALKEICSVTDNLQNIPDQFKMLEFQLQLPYKANMIYGQFDGPSNIAVIKKVNGDGGFFLKKTIHQTVIDFIWFQEENCQYLFWGSSKERVIDAMNRIRSRIIKCVKNYNPEEQVAACPPSPLPFQSRPLVDVNDIAATPPPASEYMSRQDSMLYTRSQSPSPSPSPHIQKIFRSIGEAYYYNDSCSDYDSDDE